MREALDEMFQNHKTTIFGSNRGLTIGLRGDPYASYGIVGKLHHREVQTGRLCCLLGLILQVMPIHQPWNMSRFRGVSLQFF